MRDVSDKDLTVSVLGQKINIPIGIAPVPSQCGAHPDGENVTAIAAREARTVMIVSAFSTISLEEVAKASDGGCLWFALGIYKNRNVTLDLVKRAEDAGYKAIVLNVDVPGGVRYLRNRAHYKYPDTTKYENFKPYLKNGQLVANPVPDFKCLWKDISWLKSKTRLPVVVKGILTAEDAKFAVKEGANGIIVSNRGGRTLDCVAATIEVLPEIVKAVGSKVEVYLDSGVRNGADVFKALALGAKTVFIGRPNIYGLSYEGSRGAKCILNILRQELDTTMTLAGCKNISDIKNELVIRGEYYRSYKW